MLSTWSATEVAFLLVAVIQMVATVLWLIVARVVPGARIAAVHWASYAALSAATWTSLAMELKSPPLIGVLAGVAATLALQRGIWLFIGTKPAYRLTAVLVAAVIAVGLLDVPQPLEVAVNFGVLAWLFLTMAYDLFRHAKTELHMRWPVLLALPTLFGSLGFGSRMVRAITAPDSVVTEMQRNSALNVGTALTYVVLCLALHATLMALVIGRLVRELAALSRYDALTGLLNRRAIQEELDAQLQRSRRNNEGFVLMMIDVDRFKAINDRYGHVFGDVVLKHVADQLRANLREPDRVGRFGGEEFLVMLPGSTTEAACTVAERLRAAVNTALVTHSTREIRASISIGVAEWSAADDDVSRTVVRADAALYEAKAQGRDRVVVAAQLVSATG